MRVVDIRNRGRGKARGGLSWLQVGNKLGLETVQGRGRMTPLCPAVGDVVAVCVVLSMARSVFYWLR